MSQRPIIDNSTEQQDNVRPPEFPRPSSSIARSKLKSHMGLKNIMANRSNSGKISKLTVPLKSLVFSNNEHTMIGQRSNDIVFIDNQRRGDINNINDFSMISEISSAWQESINISENSTLNKQKRTDEFVKNNSRYHNENSSNIVSMDISRKFNAVIPHLPTHTPHCKPLSKTDPSNKDIFIVAQLPGIEYVANLIINGTVEFCYVTTEPSNPYRFVVIDKPEDKQMETFVTFSKVCVSRITPGSVEHVPLHDFIREYSVYHGLMNIRLFKHFKAWYVIPLFLKNK